MLTVRIHQPAADNVLKWRRCFSCGSDAIWRTATLGNIRAMTGANELENFQFSFFKDFSRSVEQYFFSFCCCSFRACAHRVDIANVAGRVLSSSSSIVIMCCVVCPCVYSSKSRDCHCLPVGARIYTCHVFVSLMHFVAYKRFRSVDRSID